MNADAKPKPERCRHYKAWLLVCGANRESRIQWCYECGAIQTQAGGRWFKPTGKGGKNPWVSEIPETKGAKA